jgi:hypothetical protein
VLEGVDVKTAQTRLGHSDPRLTLGTYAQASSEADRDAAERVGARFAPGVRDGCGMEPGHVTDADTRTTFDVRVREWR